MAKLAARWRRQWRWFILHTYFVEWVNMYQVFFETMRIRKLHWKILVANSESLKLILNARFIDEHTMYRYRLQIRFNHCAKTAMYDKIWWVQKLFIKKYARYEPIWAIISADGGRLSQYKLCLHVHTHIENDEEHIRTDELLNNTRHSNTIYICIDPSKTNSKSKKCF